ncbi:Hypothetical_protein [Hexamita inflata]|uniref:Hypothetical_protein n=1 Tax=Hexamita inflata TaxID=28002 RepID=A0AA86RAN7_9EUKA|nr:Hypothetical protein HINF_LOCUS56978 [Hexamita inflata]
MKCYQPSWFASLFDKKPNGNNQLTKLVCSTRMETTINQAGLLSTKLVCSTRMEMLYNQAGLFDKNGKLVCSTELECYDKNGNAINQAVCLFDKNGNAINQAGLSTKLVCSTRMEMLSTKLVCLTRMEMKCNQAGLFDKNGNQIGLFDKNGKCYQPS